MTWKKVGQHSSKHMTPGDMWNNLPAPQIPSGFLQSQALVCPLDWGEFEVGTFFPDSRFSEG